MNWTFNQNCQLVFLDAPDKNEYTHTLEVVEKQSDKTIYGIFIDRTDSVNINIEDGLYCYYLLQTNNSEFIEEIKSGLNPIDRIKEYTNSNGGWTYEENIFSICKLRKCTIAQEKLAIEEFLSTCNKRNCNKRSSQQPVRDVLLISIFVLEHLISQEKYLEAERILESLDSCRNLCGNNIKTCNCNG